MRSLERSEASPVHSKSKRNKRLSGTSKTPGSVMEYQDRTGEEGHHQQHQQPQQQSQQHQQQQQQLHYSQLHSQAGSYLQNPHHHQPPETRQPQHRNPYSQPPQQALYAQTNAAYSRANPYAQSQDIPMVGVATQPLDQGYQQHHHQHQAPYLPQQAGPYVGPYSNPGQYAGPHPQAIPYQQQIAMQQQYGGIYPPIDAAMMGHPPQHMIQQSQHYLQPKVGRLPADRPLIKLSVSLIDTYKHINTIYYEERDARRAARAREKAKAKPSASQATTATGQGANNNGWDDENYDYILTPGELFYGRYKIKERIGKGSFGQVVRAEDTQENREVAIKIIKSKKPFLMQAKTEIELLTHLNEKDVDDQHNIVRLITHFLYRNHQCLVFEMLSLNLYELLKNTQFGGVSLNLIRKFAKQVLKSLTFLSRKDVDIIHCDLKPENILLRHPKKSAIKVIDFGSSCRSNKRMYSYIQSRFYRSPEVMLGLPYTVAIDMWSLGCILAEMHTGEPLFSGSDQFDQMQKIVKILGMIPSSMLDKASDQHRLQFFERIRRSPGKEEWAIKQHNTASSSRGGGASASPQSAQDIVVPSTDPIATLMEVIRADNSRKKKYPTSETGNSPLNYELFVDLIYQMLAYDPRQRIKPEEALNHPFITEQYR